MTSLKKKVTTLIVAFFTGLFISINFDPLEIFYNAIYQIPALISILGIIGIIYTFKQIEDLIDLVKKLSVLSYFLAFCAGFELLKNPSSVFPLIFFALVFALPGE
jgi:hypothetical protein